MSLVTVKHRWFLWPRCAMYWSAPSRQRWAHGIPMSYLFTPTRLPVLRSPICITHLPWPKLGPLSEKSQDIPHPAFLTGLPSPLAPPPSLPLATVEGFCAAELSGILTPKQPVPCLMLGAPSACRASLGTQKGGFHPLDGGTFLGDEADPISSA